ncbi:hypothetical protein HPG69_014402 [Diceros bicornis minor]|uniref:Uncharacterized protein n=1 Tax=Diceros bicornis minor TaxID=77932 RepID=A0A7J7EX61_DICBM|nr:hypothetical protein HPG69_014402 [Diceros bicornis minor]
MILGHTSRAAICLIAPAPTGREMVLVQLVLTNSQRMRGGNQRGMEYGKALMVSLEPSRALWMWALPELLQIWGEGVGVEWRMSKGSCGCRLVLTVLKDAQQGFSAGVHLTHVMGQNGADYMHLLMKMKILVRHKSLNT